jgi:ribose 5-phosphate isomerase A
LIENISKMNAAKEAVKFVKNGMIVGLGTGSTAKIAVDLLGNKISKIFR